MSTGNKLSKMTALTRVVGVSIQFILILFFLKTQKNFFGLGKGKTGEAKTEGREIKGKTGCKGREGKGKTGS